MQADLTGPAGRLEALFDDAADAAFAAIVCHPHPLYGGTMHTHAVYRLAKAARSRGGAALRVNFRGVGRAAGRYGGGDGEAEDARAALDWLATAKPGIPLVASGFSFGAWMANLAGGADSRASALLVAGLALRAPDLARFRDAGHVRELEKPLALVHA